MIERYMIDDAGTLIDKVTLDNFDTVEEVVSIMNHYASTLEKLVDENEQLRKDLIDHSALIRMLEDYQSLNIEDILWNLTGVESEEEFNELYEPYFDKAKNCWSKQGDDLE